MTLRSIDKYEIITTLGRGSMGVVYKAKDPEIGRLVAIKTLKSVFMGDDAAGNEALQRFRQESRSAGKLHHPNIVTIFEAGRTENGSPYIVMEYIEGKSLEAMLAEGGPLEPLAALHYLSQIASALDYAHMQSVIHRDIKPSNIIVDARYRPYLLDFGVAKLSDTSLTPAGTVVGTPSYMSPEQIRGSQLDGRTDLFSLAVVAFEVFTGSRPFPGSDFTTVVSNIIHKDPLSFADVGCALPSGLEGVLRHSLSKEREQRYPSALEFVDAAAQVFGVVLDGTGLAGGYSPGLKLPDVNAREAAARGRAQTMVGSFSPSSLSDAQAAALSAAPEGVQTVANIPMDALKHAGAAAAEKAAKDAQNYTNGISDKDDGSNYAGAANDRSKSLIPGSEKNIFDRSGGESASDRPAWIAPVIGVLVLLLLVVAAIVSKPDMLDSIKQHLGLGQAPDPDEIETPLVVEPTEPKVETKTGTLPEPTPVQVVAPVEQPSLPPVQPKSKWIKPEIPLGGLTESSVANLGDSEIGWLLSADNSDAPSKRLAAAEAGKRTGPELTDALCEAMKSPEYKARIDAMKGLSRTPHIQRRAAIDALLAALGDDEFIVRGFAAKILAGVGGAQVQSALEERLKEEKNSVVLKVLNDSLSQVKQRGQ